MLRGNQSAYLAALAALAAVAVTVSLLAYQHLDGQIDGLRSNYPYQPARDERLPTRRQGQAPLQRYEPNCRAPIDRDDSEVCAAWSAIEATTESNGLARINLWFGAGTLLLSAVGTALLLWTLGVTRSTSRRELRAYVSVTPGNLSVLDAGAGGMVLEVKVKNGGATPAYDCVHSGNIYCLPDGSAAHFFSSANEAPKIGERASYVLHGGQEIDGSINSHGTFTEIQISEIRTGKLTLFTYGSAEYLDVFGKRCESQFCYKMPARVFVEALRPWHKDGPHVIPMEWDLVPYHNTAT